MPQLPNARIREGIGPPLLFIGGTVCIIAVVLAITTASTWGWLGIVGIVVVLLGLDFGPAGRR